jgi:hypothetical protein
LLLPLFCSVWQQQQQQRLLGKPDLTLSLSLSMLHELGAGKVELELPERLSSIEEKLKVLNAVSRLCKQSGLSRGRFRACTSVYLGEHCSNRRNHFAINNFPTAKRFLPTKTSTFFLFYSMNCQSHFELRGWRKKSPVSP